MARRTPIPAIVASLWLVFDNGASWAQIRTDASLGQPARALTGPGFVIPENLGRLARNNLFHSFETFNIGGGESATFTTATAGIANVISRVTGGGASSINGALRLHAAAGAPAFFFINPAGVTFGAGARIDVPGAFHVSTADYVKFADGNWYADIDRASAFSSAPPEAFGFLGAASGVIRVTGAAFASDTQAIDAVAGDIVLNNSRIRSASADIRIVALGQPAATREIGLTGRVPQAAGIFSMVNGSEIGTSAAGATGGGDIYIAAGSATVNQSTIQSSVDLEASATGGSVTIEAAGAMQLVSGGRVASDTGGSGKAGDIFVTADSLAVDAQGRSAVTGISTETRSTSTGSGGMVAVDVAGAMSVVNRGVVNTNSNGTAPAGDVLVTAGSLTIDGRGSSSTTGIYSESSFMGNGGRVAVNVAGPLRILDGGTVASYALDAGSAQDISVSAGSLTVDGLNKELMTGILSETDAFTSGAGGNVIVEVVETASVLNGGRIGTETWGSGKGGNTLVTAGSLALDSGGNDVAKGIYSRTGWTASGDAGALKVEAAGALNVTKGGSIFSESSGRGNAGGVAVTAGSLTVDGGRTWATTAIYSQTQWSSTGNAGTVSVDVAGAMDVRGGGYVSSETRSTGMAGDTSVTAGSLTLDGQRFALWDTGLFSDASGTGNAGKLTVNVAGALNVLDGAQISSNTWNSGRAGNVMVTAGTLTLDRRGGYTTSIRSSAMRGSTGDAGTVTVKADGAINILNGGSISSDTGGSGKAGRVGIEAGSLRADAQGFTGGGTGISSEALRGTGHAGTVTVDVDGTLELIHGATISSSTWTSGKAGTVAVTAKSLIIDGQGGAAGGTGIVSSAENGTGDAGTVTVSVEEGRIVNGGFISSSTWTSGKAGDVAVTAGSLTLDGQGLTEFGTGIASAAFLGTGNAGTIRVDVPRTLAIFDGAQINSSTWTTGKAGDVSVTAGSIVIDGKGNTLRPTAIASDARAGSGGQTGSVRVSALDSLSLRNVGRISIKNEANVAVPSALVPTVLTAAAPVVTLKDAAITAESTGNVAASNIVINAGRLLYLDPSSITTAANEGDGGSITINSGGAVWLANSKITTSVAGLAGNGGDIAVNADVLLLETGFIQANTAAAAAHGGNIAINVATLIPSHSTVLVGSATPQLFQPFASGYNVIQAAAPTGVSGAIAVTAPALDLSGSLTGLSARMMDPARLGRNPCRAGGGSSLSQTGRGGLPPPVAGPLRLETPPADVEALARPVAHTGPWLVASLPSRCL